MDMEEMRRLYVDERLSSREVAKRLRCSASVVTRRLREIGVYIRNTGTDIEKFMDKVRIDEATGCWNWIGSHTIHGQAKFAPNGPSSVCVAHRWFYKKFIDANLPDDMVLDHLCRNRQCVNMDHIEPVTHKENIMRGETIFAEAAAKTECKWGHPYNDQNTGRTREGARFCKECQRLAYRGEHPRGLSKHTGRSTADRARQIETMTSDFSDFVLAFLKSSDPRGVRVAQIAETLALSLPDTRSLLGSMRKQARIECCPITKRWRIQSNLAGNSSSQEDQ